MKTKKWIKASMLSMMAILLAACASEDIAQDKKKENGTEAPKGGVIFAANGPKASAKRLAIDGEDEFAGAKTRTNIKHTVGQGADAYWTSDDFIWVKDKNGTWQKSTGTTLHDGGASAEFTLPGNKTDYADGCEVRYTGIGQAYYRNSPSYSTIGIPDNQSRTAANDFSHAGEWGDCGSGKAYNTGNPDKFNFSLSHKPAYLCFLPRCTNGALAPNIRLKSIKIDADIQYTTTGFFANYSEFDGEDIRTTDGTPFGGNIITVTLPDFPLYTTENQEANATYLVVRPGKYDFSIEYTIKDPTTNVETVIKDTRTGITLDKGNIYDVTANLVPMGLYYMWDAKQDYWNGYESEQPLIEQWHPGGTQGQHYPQTTDDPRYTHDSGDAQTDFFKTLPNINELMWYMYAGDPRWVYAQNVVIARKGHLQKVNYDGVWIRKKKVIISYLKTSLGYSSITEADMKESYWWSPTNRVDYRGTNAPQFSATNPGAPADTYNYFFLPTSGCYHSGWLNQNNIGYYWSSSPTSGNGRAFALQFSDGHIDILPYQRTEGFQAVPFE